jgi:hypothetical protein
MSEKHKRRFRCAECGHELITEVLPSVDCIDCPACCDGIMYRQCSDRCRSNCHVSHEGDQGPSCETAWQDLYGPLS